MTDSLHLTSRDLTVLADLLLSGRTAFSFLSRDMEDDRPLCIWDTFIHDLADLCQAGNPRFSREKFYRAAGLAKAAEFEAKLSHPEHIPTIFVFEDEPVRLRLGD